MKNSKSIRSYHEVKDGTALSDETPEELISKLFAKACSLLRTSLAHSDSSDEEAFQQSTLHALQIVLSLRFVLDTSTENEQALAFYETYTSIAASLIRAKNTKDPASLKKIHLALEELGGAWAAITKPPT